MRGDQYGIEFGEGVTASYELERERQQRELEKEIRQRQLLVEVLPPISDADEAQATLDYVMGQLDRAQRAYEELVSLVEDGFAIITPADEVARCLADQAVPMRRAMLAILPHISDMRDKNGNKGPVLRGIETALSATDDEPTSVSIAKAYGLVCAVCCAMARGLARVWPESNVAPVQLDMEASLSSAPDSHFLEMLGYVLEAHWWQVKLPGTPEGPLDRMSMLGIRCRFEGCRQLDVDDVEALTAIGFWASTAWAEYALNAEAYVDAVERLQCVVVGGEVTAPAWGRKEFRDSILDTIPQYGPFICISVDEEVAQWVGDTAYAASPVGSSKLIWVYPRLSYLAKLRSMLGMQDVIEAEGDAGLAEWERLARLPKAFVRGSQLCLPIREVEKATYLFFDRFAMRVEGDHLEVSNPPGTNPLYSGFARFVER